MEIPFGSALAKTEAWKKLCWEIGLEETEIREGLRSFLRAVPRDASHAGVALAADGTPSEEDIARVAGNMVHLVFPPLRCRIPGR